MVIQAKSVQYWPEERNSHSIVYDDLQIHLRRRIITKNYSTTTLLLQHQDVCTLLCKGHQKSGSDFSRKWCVER